MAVERPQPADENVGVKRLSKRQAVREPSILTRLEPGESIELWDRHGALIVQRKKKSIRTNEQRRAVVHKLTAHWRPFNVLDLLDR